MTFTKDDIMRYVETRKVSPWLKGRFRDNVLGRYPNVHMFLTASVEDYERIDGYGKALRELTIAVRDEFYMRQKSEKDKLEFDERVVAYKKELTEAHNAAVAKLNPVFTLPELQGIVSFMQLMNLDEIDLKRIINFMDSIRVERGEAKEQHA